MGKDACSRAPSGPKRPPNADPTESQRGCPSLLCGARSTGISNTECAPIPLRAPRPDGLEMRLVGKPATRVRIPLAPHFP
jgi:hypothetical protein